MTKNLVERIANLECMIDILRHEIAKSNILANGAVDIAIDAQDKADDTNRIYCDLGRWVADIDDRLVGLEATT